MAYASVEEVEILLDVGMYLSKGLDKWGVFDHQRKGPVGSTTTVCHLEKLVSLRYCDCTRQLLTFVYRFISSTTQSTPQKPSF